MAAAAANDGYSALPWIPPAANNGYRALPGAGAAAPRLPWASIGSEPAFNGYVTLAGTPALAPQPKIPGLMLETPAPTTAGIYSFDEGLGHPGPSVFVMPDGTSFNDFVKSKAYTTHTYLGHGFFSSAYKLTFPSAQYVLKVGDRNYVRSFVEKEAFALSALKDNRYVNRLLVAQIEPSTSYMLIEYIPGKTLEQWIAERPAPAERSAVKQELRNGIASIHAAGFVHTDIKADNIWIPDDRSRPAIFIDFGLAERIGTERKRVNGRTSRVNASVNMRAIDNMFSTFGGGRATRKRKTRKMRRHL